MSEVKQTHVFRYTKVDDNKMKTNLNEVTNKKYLMPTKFGLFSSLLGLLQRKC